MTFRERWIPNFRTDNNDSVFKSVNYNGNHRFQKQGNNSWMADDFFWSTRSQSVLTFIIQSSLLTTYIRIYYHYYCLNDSGMIRGIGHVLLKY